MIIEKKQNNKQNHLFNWTYYDSARQGLKQVLLCENLRGKKILLPAYIGYSTNEGSGVFDPVIETNTEYIFYRLKKSLNIKIEDIKNKIKANKNNIILIIHYFGFVDNNLELIKQYARKYNMIIIEDFAHALFNFHLNPVIDFNYGIFSLHKLLPFYCGGMVLSKSKKKIKSTDISYYNISSYDLISIASKRIRNYHFLLSLIKEKFKNKNIIILRKHLKNNIPQSFPILLSNRDIRDKLYFQLNKDGYGVTSLYHTLISEIDDQFLVENTISSTILNLPIHQDVGKASIRQMIDRLFSII